MARFTRCVAISKGVCLLNNKSRVDKIVRTMITSLQTVVESTFQGNQIVVWTARVFEWY